MENSNTGTIGQTTGQESHFPKTEYRDAVNAVVSVSISAEDFDALAGAGINPEDYAYYYFNLPRQAGMQC